LLLSDGDIDPCDESVGFADDAASDWLTDDAPELAADDASLAPNVEDEASELGLSLRAGDAPAPWVDKRWTQAHHVETVEGDALALVGGRVMVAGPQLVSLECSGPRQSRVLCSAPPARLVQVVALDDASALCATAVGSLLCYSEATGSLRPHGDLAEALKLGADEDPSWRLIAGSDEPTGRWVAGLTRRGAVARLGRGCPLTDEVAGRLRGPVRCDGDFVGELRSGAVWVSSDRGASFAPAPGCGGASAFHLSALSGTLWVATFAAGPQVTIVSVALADLTAKRLFEFTPLPLVVDDEPSVRDLVWDDTHKQLWLTGSFGVLAISPDAEPPEPLHGTL
jgi:hypothetical protein